jgi:hypothetical protein
MGTSVSEATWERTQANRRANRYCQGAASCSARATVYVAQQSLTRRNLMVMCARHARGLHAGYEGQNFIVTGVAPIPRGASASEIQQMRDDIAAAPSYVEREKVVR